MISFVVLETDRRQTRLVQGGDRHCTGVVGIVLVRSPRSEHPHPSNQIRRHLHDVFAAGDQLLRNEAVPADAAGKDSSPTRLPILNPT